MKKVITYGTFDLFHQGHYNILKRAKACGDYLIVGITSESYDIQRCKMGVRDSLATRIENVRKTGFADEIIIEEFQGQKIQDVQKYGVDVLVEGSDWYGKFDYLKPYCEVVYLERTKDISSTQLRMRDQFLHVGLMLDKPDDNHFVMESKYVSGVHVERVYAPDQALSEALNEQYVLNGGFADRDAFLEGVDAVYVHGAPEFKFECAKAALLHGKHVLCSFPMAGTAEDMRKLASIAAQKNLILLDCLPLAYLHAFNQLMWMVESGTIGEALSLKCAISTEADPALSGVPVHFYALYAALRLCGAEAAETFVFDKPIGKGRRYSNLFLKTPKTAACLEIGQGVQLHCGLTILGESGQIIVPDDWWNTSYFETIRYDGSKKRYCYNYDGNGMRYILRELLIMLRENRTQSHRFPHEESIRLTEMYSRLMNQEVRS